MPKDRETDFIRRSLKIATRNQIKDCGGLEAAAVNARVGKTELSSYQSENMAERFMPLDVAVELMHASGSLEILEAMAAILDASVEPQRLDGAALEEDLISLGEHAAATFRDYAALMAKKMEPGEKKCRQLDADLALVVRSALEARRHLRSRLC
jgi:hypothetical protein